MEMWSHPQWGWDPATLTNAHVLRCYMGQTLTTFVGSGPEGQSQNTQISAF